MALQRRTRAHLDERSALALALWGALGVSALASHDARPAVVAAGVIEIAEEPTEGPYRYAAGTDLETLAIPEGTTGLVRGRSSVTVNAPAERVRETVLGFARYPEFMPHYAKCRVLGRSPSGGRDVYMQVEALHGALSMWARVDVKRPHTDDGVESIEAKMLEGNVKELRAAWRLVRLDERRTRLTLEVFLNPKVPVPEGLLNAENLDGSAAGVLALKARAEGTASPP